MEITIIFYLKKYTILDTTQNNIEFYKFIIIITSIIICIIKKCIGVAL